MADFEPLRALGLMSGTSMDGVDAAVLVTDGVTISEFGESAFRPYSTDEATFLANNLGTWPQDNPMMSEVVEALVDMVHIQAVENFTNIDVIGFHGQTLAHDPENGRTYQAGNGEVVAAMTDVKTVWDFRTQDMREGGQGAPLAPFFHFACAKWAGLTEPTAFLNLGGVGNVTLVDPSKPTPETPGALLAFDTGPANAPLNDLVKTLFGWDYDKNGAFAATGQVHEAIITRVFQRPFFAQPAPKSLDRDDFHDALSWVADLSDKDAAATLTALPAACVAANLSHLPIEPKRWLVSGGGAQNPTMMRELQDRLPGTVQKIEEIGLDGDMLEAQAFAYLAVRVLRGLPTSAPSTTGCKTPTSGSKITA